MLLQLRAAADLNQDYLAREAATMRTAKTSSTALIKACGKAGKQMHHVHAPGTAGLGTIDSTQPASHQTSCTSLAGLLITAFRIECSRLHTRFDE